MHDVEKSLGSESQPLGAQPPVVDSLPTNFDHEKPSSDDAGDTKEAEEKTEKEKGGGFKDYFVSSHQERRSRMQLIPRQRIFQYADRLDIFLYAVSLSGGIATGAALPLMTIVFGSSTASFNTVATGQSSADEFTARINHLILYFVYLFVARFVIGYFATLFICIAATRTTRNLRKAFLESLLRQEVWHFDKEGNGSPATQVTMSA